MHRKREFFGAVPLWTGVAQKIPIYRADPPSFISPPVTIGWQTKNPDYPCYAIAKSSVNGLTRGLAASLGKDHIRVNTITPGWVMTERQVRLWLDAAGEQEIARNQCLPDQLRPDHVASMVLFLAADDSAMCTAQEFVVDGGWT